MSDIRGIVWYIYIEFDASITNIRVTYQMGST